MNKLSPYEQSLSEQLTNIPLPEEDNAWQEMEKLLRKEEEDRLVPPPPPAGGCGNRALLVIIALIAALFLIWYGINKKNSGKKKEAGPINADNHLPNEIEQNRDTTVAINTFSIPDSGRQITVKNNLAGNPDNINPQFNNDSIGINATLENSIGLKGKSTVSISGKISTIDDALLNNQGTHTTSDSLGSGKVKVIKKKSVAAGKTRVAIKPVIPEGDLSDASQDANSDTLVTYPVISPGFETRDTITKKEKIIDEPVVAKDSGKTKDTKNTKLFFSAGAAVYKGLPLNGATDIAINNNGRKGALTDYIPSVYVRLNKADKWFLQSEFRYGVPQYTRSFIYLENVKVDTTQVRTTTSRRLRKTYYHQVPVSFNYYIFKGLSVGTGIVYNRFTSSVSEETVRRQIPGTVNDTLVSFSVVTDRNDSAFVKNTFQWQAEAQYKWKRFSLGARYSEGFVPYIRYIDPVSGNPSNKRNNALYIFLLYELLNLRKKK